MEQRKCITVTLNSAQQKGKGGGGGVECYGKEAGNTAPSFFQSRLSFLQKFFLLSLSFLYGWGPAKEKSYEWHGLKTPTQDEMVTNGTKMG